MALRGCGKREAAEEIIRGAGKVPEDDGRRPAPAAAAKKAKAVIPVPDSALPALPAMTRSDWYKAKHGEPAKGWTYRDAEGREWLARRRRKSSE